MKIGSLCPKFELCGDLRYAIGSVTEQVEDCGGRKRAQSCQVGYTQVTLALKTGGALETEDESKMIARSE